MSLVDYQNTCYVLSQERRKSPEELVSRCEELLRCCEKFSRNGGSNDNTKINDSTHLPAAENSYLNMTRNRKCVTSPSNSVADASDSATDFPNDYVTINALPSTSDHENDTEAKDIYDTFTVPAISATPMDAATTKSGEDQNDLQNCPYLGLPAAHLSIKKSPKQGQLTRIEKRIFFDQSKKYFCGVVGDWLLCYADGSASIKPSLCVHLCPGTEIDRYGEGKRRDLCFQISTAVGKRYIFQSNSEIDAKGWIHALDGTVRGIYRDSPISAVIASDRLLIKTQSNNLRKLPTPPGTKKLYPDLSSSVISSDSGNNDEIYEVPCPLYKSLDLIPPNKLLHSEVKCAAEKYEEYDVPRSLPVNPVTIKPGTVSIEQPTLDDTLQEEESPVKVKQVQPEPSAQSQPQPSPPQSIDNTTERIKELQSGSDNSKPPPSPAISPVSKQTVKACSQTSPGLGSATTPVRNWFLNRLNKTSPNQPQQHHPIRSPQRSLIKHQKNLKENMDNAQNDGWTGVTNRILVASAKGEKVNKIVNQLVDANGRLPIFRNNGSGKNSENITESTQGFSIDDMNYEFINTNSKA